jgi:hypothetical protein
MPNFADVKAILDGIKDNFSWDEVKRRHSADDAQMAHPLDWQTKAQLQAAEVWRYEGDQSQVVKYRLIDLANGKTAKDTYLIKALSGKFKAQVDPGLYDQMPYGGPYLKPEELGTISAWIDAGMPD